MRVVLPVLLATLGCGPTTGDSGGGRTCSGLEVSLGEGAFAYAPREDGDAVTLVHGPQGGWHVELAGEVRGSRGAVRLVPSVVEATQQVSIAGEGQEDEPPVQLSGWSASTCAGTFYGFRVFVDDVDPGGSYQRFICTLRDNPLRITVTATDAQTGEQAVGEWNAVAALDPDDVPICAQY